jgi:hypothetical protein
VRFVRVIVLQGVEHHLFGGEAYFETTENPAMTMVG